MAVRRFLEDDILKYLTFQQLIFIADKDVTERHLRLVYRKHSIIFMKIEPPDVIPEKVQDMYCNISKDSLLDRLS